MDIVLLAEMLLLISVANGTPVVVAKIFGSRFDGPLDFGARFVDGRPFFGKSKTWRGALSSIAATALVAALIGYELITGAAFGFAAMLGDLCSSFTKRRLSMPSSSMALGLDQVPEAAFPLLLFYTSFSLTVADVLIIVVLFFVGELLVSRLLYSVNLRDRPY